MIFILKSEDILNRCQAYIKSHGMGMQVSIGKPGKTGAQRRFFHTLIDIISKHTGESKEVEKMRAKFAILPLEEIWIDGHRHLFPISSEDTSIDQYSQLIDYCYIRGNFLELQLPSPPMLGFEL